MAGVPRKQPVADDALSLALIEIRSGAADDRLIEVIEAVNERKEQLKARVDELVRATYGGDARVVVGQPQAQPVYRNESIVPAAPPLNIPDGGQLSPDDLARIEALAAESNADFPEPVVSGTIYERMQAGLGPVEQPVISAGDELVDDVDIS